MNFQSYLLMMVFDTGKSIGTFVNAWKKLNLFVIELLKRKFRRKVGNFWDFFDSCPHGGNSLNLGFMCKVAIKA